MSGKLGKRQLGWLSGVGKPGTYYVVPSKDFEPLKRKGLMKSWGKDGSFIGITALGLRALADAAETGALDLSLKKFPKRKPTRHPITGAGGVAPSTSHMKE